MDTVWAGTSLNEEDTEKLLNFYRQENPNLTVAEAQEMFVYFIHHNWWKENQQ